ncbi:MAG: hypothetical protein IJV60_04690 [Prevotella sp.]|nr:hypothetical protein [Prevotella sp.]MBQ8114604.1 hypothetical protein [Prevotella sp.]
MKAIDKIITKMRHAAPSFTGRVCAGLLFAGLALTSCSDYFDPSPKGIMDADDSFSEGNQTYKGMLGVINAVQQAGDHAIFLTDTRMNVLETTPNAPAALQSIYKYDDTDNNEYADPTCYYKIIIACNDYIKKMERLHATPGALSVTDQTFFKPLLSCAIRFKVWAYLQLGRNYGEAYWFDDALSDQVSLSDISVFEHCDMQALSAKCLALLESGITVDGVSVPATLNMNWYQWFDSENQSQSIYSKWQYLAPPFILLKAELLSWKCNYESDEEAKQDWLWIRNNILQYFYKIHTATEAVELSNLVVDGVTYTIPGFATDAEVTSMSNMYMTNIPMQSDATNAYYNIFYSEGIGNPYQVAGTITYDYDNNVRNRLVQYFCPTYPGDGFYLKPSDYAVRAKTSSYDEGLYETTDIRSLTQKMVMNSLGGEQAVLTKYYYTYVAGSRTYKYLRDDIEKIQPSIVTFRGHDFHFLLAEAENHLGNWQIAQALLNGGITNLFAQRAGTGGGTADEEWSSMIIRMQGLAEEATEEWRKSFDPERTIDSAYYFVDSLEASYRWNFVLRRAQTEGTAWSPYYSTWFGGSGGYGDSGLAGTANGGFYDAFVFNGEEFELRQQNSDVLLATMTEAERREYIDWCLAKEYSKEYVAEGKAYGYLCKMAERYSHAGRGSRLTAADKMADIIAPKYTGALQSKVRSSLQGKYFINWNLK